MGVDSQDDVDDDDDDDDDFEDVVKRVRTAKVQATSAPETVKKVPVHLLLGVTVESGEPVRLESFAGANYVAYDKDNVARSSIILGPKKVISKCRAALKTALVNKFNGALAGNFGTATTIGRSEQRTKVALLSGVEFELLRDAMNLRCAQGESGEDLRTELAKASLPESAVPAEDLTDVLGNIGPALKIPLTSSALDTGR